MNRRRGRRAPRRRRNRSVLPVLLLASAINIVIVWTATNTVPATLADNQTAPIEANDLKPLECAALDLTHVEGGSVTVTGTAANDLVLGSELLDSIDGMGGDDCLVAGPGTDTLDGGAGDDVCLGGPEVDTFISCETEIQ